MSPYPEWLDALSWFSLGVSFVCALVILFHEFRHPQKMFIMNLVWPITALYWSVVGLWAYFRVGSRMTKEHQQQQQQQQHQQQQQKQEGGGSEEPSRSQTSVSVLHCGAGCTLGDITGEL